MFFDYFDEEDELDAPVVDPENLAPEGSGLPEDPDAKPRKPHPSEIVNDGKKAVDKKKSEGKWRRIERTIYSPFWRAMHNLIAHPMLAIYRPWGEWLHEFTARKMYEPRPGLVPIVTNND